jgi:hypothetical protein
MIFLDQLWIPIILSALLVFGASSLIHMVLKWHNSDYLKFRNEDEVRAAIRATNPVPGQYILPHFPDMKDMQRPEAQQKYKEGPIGFLFLKASGVPRMGASLGFWFLLNVVIAFLAAYLASRTLPTGASFLQVCRVVGTVSFLAYAGGSVQSGIWMGKPWRSVAKEIADGIIYGAVSAAVFGWLWPH